MIDHPTRPGGHRLLLRAAILAAFLAFAFGAQASVQKNGPGFAPGEKLTFRLSWGIVPAGEVVLEVLPFTEIAGEKAYHFSLTARTNAFVDNFYRLRQRIDAYADAGLNRSLLYREVYTMNQRRRNATLTFDWANHIARYSDLGASRDPVPLHPGAFDPLSVFYFSRLFALEEDMELKRPVTDGKKITMGRARVIRKETVTVPSGSFDTFLLEPDTAEVRGVFEKSRDAKIQIWVTADERRIPVRLRSKVAVGSFVGELVAIGGAPAPAPAAAPAKGKPPETVLRPN